MSCLGVNTPRRDCVGLLALLVGLRLFFLHFAGVARALRARLPPAYVISPLKGLLNSAGIRPQGIPYKLPFGEFFEVPKLYFNACFRINRLNIGL